MEEINLKKVKVKELRRLLKKCGIKGASKMSKKEIIEMIEGNKETLEGAGFFDFLKGIGRVITQPVRTIKKLISPMEEYNYESEETLKKYGKLPIMEIEIIRTPISGMINTIFNALSLGKWEQLKKKFGYDKFFHLAMKTVVKLPDGKTKDIFIEKEEAPVIHTRYKENPQTERFKLTNYFRGTQTIKGMLDETLRKIGNHNFFKYEAFTINCQRFLMDILKSNELLTPEAEEFIYQPLDELVQELPQYVRGTAKAITDLGGIFSKLTGRGEDDEVLEGGVREWYCGAKDTPPAGRRFGTREECKEAPSQIRRYGNMLVQEQQPKQKPKQQKQKGKYEEDSEAEDSDEEIQQQKPDKKPELPKETIKEIKDADYPKQVEKDIIEKAKKDPNLVLVNMTDIKNYPLTINPKASNDDEIQDLEQNLFIYPTIELLKVFTDKLTIEQSYINGSTKFILDIIQKLIKSPVIEKKDIEKIKKNNIDFITSFVDKYPDDNLDKITQILVDKVKDFEFENPFWNDINDNERIYFLVGVLKLFSNYSDNHPRNQPLFKEVKNIFDDKIGANTKQKEKIIKDTSLLVENYKGDDMLFTIYPTNAYYSEYYNKCLNVIHKQSGIKDLCYNILKEEGKNYVWFICNISNMKRKTWKDKNKEKFNDLINKVLDNSLEKHYEKNNVGRAQICSPSLYADIYPLGAVVLNRRKNVIEITTFCEFKKDVKLTNRNIKDFINVDKNYKVPRSSNRLYIDYLCSNGGARDLFNALKKENLLKDENAFSEKFLKNLRFIHLSAINSFNTLNFYYNHGWYRTSDLEFPEEQAEEYNNILEMNFFSLNPDDRLEIFKNMTGIFGVNNENNLYAYNSPLQSSGLTPYYYFYDDNLKEAFKKFYDDDEDEGVFNKANEGEKNLIDVMIRIIEENSTDGIYERIILKLKYIQKFINDNKSKVRGSRPTRKICFKSFEDYKLEGGKKNNIIEIIKDIDDNDNIEDDELLEIYNDFNNNIEGGMSGGSRLRNLENDLTSMDRRLDAMEREAEEMLSLETELRDNINELRQQLSLIDDDRDRQVYRTQINMYNQQLENILNRNPELIQEFQQLLERRNEIYDEIERIIDGERQEERAREARGDGDIAEAREAISASAVEPAPAPLVDSDSDEFHFHPRGAIDSDSEGSFAPLRPRLNAMDGDSMEGDGKSEGYCCERCRLNQMIKNKLQGLQF